MNNVAREAALEKIRTSSTTRVILISLGAGSTGLNLVCCSRVILMVSRSRLRDSTRR